jgi:hypothetical protein
MTSSPLRTSILLLAAIGAGFAAGRLTVGSQGQQELRRAPVALVRPSESHDLPPATIVERPISVLSSNDEWSNWSTRPPTPQGDRKLAELIEAMAKNAPERAMDLAAKEQSLRRRELLREAALHGWASVSPDAALAAAMKLPGIDNRAAIAAVLDGAAVDPAAVIALGRKISDGSGPVALDYGNLAITALTDHGHYEEAVRFAAAGAASNQAQWLDAAFVAWAREQPQQALAGLDQISDPAMRREAFQGVVQGWVETDPGSLAGRAINEPLSEDRSMELQQALTSWVSRDPVAASNWLSERDADPNLDSGIAAVATMSSLMSQRPEVAAEWAQSISDPQLRQGTLHTIGDEWRRQSPATLQNFLQANPRLSEADRAALAGGG